MVHGTGSLIITAPHARTPIHSYTVRPEAARKEDETLILHAGIPNQDT
jgi:hypothetical protein